MATALATGTIKSKAADAVIIANDADRRAFDVDHGVLLLLRRQFGIFREGF